MKIKYTLKRVQNIEEKLRSDARILEYIKKTANERHRQRFMEQDLGMVPIAVKDFLYQTLKI